MSLSSAFVRPEASLAHGPYVTSSGMILEQHVQVTFQDISGMRVCTDPLFKNATEMLYDPVRRGDSMIGHHRDSELYMEKDGTSLSKVILTEKRLSEGTFAAEYKANTTSANLSAAEAA